MAVREECKIAYWIDSKLSDMKILERQLLARCKNDLAKYRDVIQYTGQDLLCRSRMTGKESGLQWADKC